jgi:hypothetical protein
MHAAEKLADRDPPPLSARPTNIPSRSNGRRALCNAGISRAGRGEEGDQVLSEGAAPVNNAARVWLIRRASSRTRGPLRGTLAFVHPASAIHNAAWMAQLHRRRSRMPRRRRGWRGMRTIIATAGPRSIFRQTRLRSGRNKIGQKELRGGVCFECAAIPGTARLKDGTARHSGEERNQ